MDVDVAALLPPDDATDGFDNIADALGNSPALIQGYVSAAMKISRRAVGDRTLIPSQVTYNAPGGFSQDRHIEGLPLGTRGGMLIQHTFPVDAEYEFTDWRRFGALRWRGHHDRWRQKSTSGILAISGLPIQAGPHTIGAAVVDRTQGRGRRRAVFRFRVNSAFSVGGGVNSIVINGPFRHAGAGRYAEPAADLRLPSGLTPLKNRPARGRSSATLARRAFRRPVAEVGIDDADEFLSAGPQRMRISKPASSRRWRAFSSLRRFLYRVEEEPAGLADGGIYRLSNLALASRLSFFLWSSMPDDELLDVAVKGRLSDPKVLEQQMRRMLADSEVADR